MGLYQVNKEASVSSRLYNIMKDGELDDIERVLRNREILIEVNYYSFESYQTIDFKMDLDIALKEIELNEMQRIILRLILKDKSIKTIRLITGLSRKGILKHRYRIADKLSEYFNK